MSEPLCSLVFAGYPEYTPFAGKLKAEELDVLRPLRLFTGSHVGQDKAGTVIPLTPPISVKEDGVEQHVIMGFTARHCTLDDGKPVRLACTHNPIAKWHEVPEVRVSLLDEAVLGS